MRRENKVAHTITKYKTNHSLNLTPSFFSLLTTPAPPHLPSPTPHHTSSTLQHTIALIPSTISATIALTPWTNCPLLHPLWESRHCSQHISRARNLRRYIHSGTLSTSIPIESEYHRLFESLTCIVLSLEYCRCLGRALEHAVDLLPCKYASIGNALPSPASPLSHKCIWGRGGAPEGAGNLSPCNAAEIVDVPLSLSLALAHSHNKLVRLRSFSSPTPSHRDIVFIACS